MRVKGARPVEDLLGPLMSLQERRRRLHRKKEASKVVRFTARLLESNFKRMKRARQLFREVDKGFLLSLEFSQQGEMGIERRASIKSTQVGDHAGKTVGYLTRWDKPEMKGTHRRCSATYSTVTLFARFRGRSTSMLRSVAI